MGDKRASTLALSSAFTRLRFDVFVLTFPSTNAVVNCSIHIKHVLMLFRRGVFSDSFFSPSIPLKPISGGDSDLVSLIFCPSHRNLKNPKTENRLADSGTRESKQ